MRSVLNVEYESGSVAGNDPCIWGDSMLWDTMRPADYSRSHGWLINSTVAHDLETWLNRSIITLVGSQSLL